MESFYLVTFAVLVALCAALELSKQREGKALTNAAFRAFRNNYLLVYALMMAGDWLQVSVAHPRPTRIMRFICASGRACLCACDVRGR